MVVSASSKGYSYETYVDDLPFDDAHAAFLSKLSGASMLQRLQLSESRGDTQALEHLRGQQLQESIYIRENWHEHTDEAKTAMGYLKSRGACVRAGDSSDGCGNARCGDGILITLAAR